MPHISAEVQEKLSLAIHSHDFLHRLLRRIEQLHRIVFHADTLDVKFLRASAREILIADIVTRHQGGIDGVYFALRAIEDGGRDWQSAIEEYGSYIHNYYTTPLGVLIRRDLFGKSSHFVTPNAGEESAMLTSEKMQGTSARTE